MVLSCLCEEFKSEALNFVIVKLYLQIYIHTFYFTLDLDSQQNEMEVQRFPIYSLTPHTIQPVHFVLLNILTFKIVRNNNFLYPRIYFYR